MRIYDPQFNMMYDMMSTQPGRLDYFINAKLLHHILCIMHRIRWFSNILFVSLWLPHEEQVSVANILPGGTPWVKKLTAGERAGGDAGLCWWPTSFKKENY